MTKYTKEIETLVHNLHRDIVQTVALKDIKFNGNYLFNENIISFFKCYDLRNREFLPYGEIKIIGITNMGHPIAISDDKLIDVRYCDIPIKTLNKMLEAIDLNEIKKVDPKGMEMLSYGW